MRQVIVLSGPISSGKSSLADGLARRYGGRVVRTRVYLAELLGLTQDRDTLQAAGDRLDESTGGRWVTEAVQSSGAGVDSELIVVDSVRIQPQLAALREAYGRAVVHIHLRAPIETLEQRYAERSAASPGTEFASYTEARRNPTEAAVDQLDADADIVIDTSRNHPDHVLTRAAARLGLMGRRHTPLVDVLVGGQYGSEGKGNVAAYLAPEYELLVRSGGPNAGHSVWRPDRVQIQHHLPSGTTVSDARLALTSGAVVHVDELLAEIEDSNVDRARLTIDPLATIIEEAHREEEARLQEQIGSTRSGVGAATAGRILGRHDPPRLAKDVPELAPYLRPAHQILGECFAAGQRVLIEGTQGTGLSLLHGHYPYVTSRDTTASGILAEAGVPPLRVNRVIMVVRTYPIRVADPANSDATSGPLWGQLQWETIAERSGLDLDALLKQEHTTRTKRVRRVGEFDWTQLVAAAELNAPTDIALTFVDQIHETNRMARRFDQLTPQTIQFIEEVERVAGAPVTLVSTRFHQRSVIDRRSW